MIRLIKEVSYIKNSGDDIIHNFKSSFKNIAEQQFAE